MVPRRACLRRDTRRAGLFIAIQFGCIKHIERSQADTEMNNVKQPVPQIFIGPGLPSGRRRQSFHDQIVEDLRLRLLESRIAPGKKFPKKHYVRNWKFLERL